MGNLWWFHQASQSKCSLMKVVQLCKYTFNSQFDNIIFQLSFGMNPGSITLKCGLTHLLNRCELSV